MVTNEHLYRSEHLLWNSTDVGTSLVERAPSDGLDELCFLYGSKLLSADHTCRGQVKGSQCQRFGDRRNLFPVPGNYSGIAESILPETTVYETEKDSRQF